MAADHSPDHSWALDDFDRDYYDELKEEYKNMKNVHIIAKDDYQLHDIDTPHLFDNRARDLDQIREEMASRPGAQLDQHTRVDSAMTLTDMHSEDELQHFKKTLRTHDAVNGKRWQDPMPQSDLDGDLHNIDFRKPPQPQADPREEDLRATLGESNLLRRKQFESQQHEMDALSVTYDMMYSETDDDFEEPFTSDADFDAPDPDDFARWQAEANARGGSATAGESFDLPPFKQPPTEAQSPHSPAELVPPHQQRTFASAHRGAWQGTARVISLDAGDRFSPRLAGSFSVSTGVEQEADGAVRWSSTASSETLELVSQVRVPSPKHGEALVPGRAVSADGCYIVCSKSSITRKDTEFFTVSRACLASLTDDKSCRPELEIAVNTAHEGVAVRHRIFLCTSGGKSATEENQQTSKNKKAPFSHIVVLRECRPTDSTANTSSTEHELELTSAADLLGLWHGHGIVFQPEYPLESCVHIVTRYEASKEHRITENDVTWVEKHIPDDPNQASRLRERTVKKKKVSRRVKEARMHDRRRLSDCQILTREDYGTAIQEQKFAWKLTPSSESFSSMYSPRIGRFVCDYGALLVSKQVLLAFPVDNAFPNAWNTVSAIELSRPSRLRIEAGRSEEGTLVGALFIKESEEGVAESDSVASYV